MMEISPIRESSTPRHSPHRVVIERPPNPLPVRLRPTVLPGISFSPTITRLDGHARARALPGERSRWSRVSSKRSAMRFVERRTRRTPQAILSARESTRRKGTASTPLPFPGRIDNVCPAPSPGTSGRLFPGRVEHGCLAGGGWAGRHGSRDAKASACCRETASRR